MTLELVVSNTHETLNKLHEELKDHIRRVDRSSKKTQNLPDSQLKRAKAVLRCAEQFKEILNSYAFTSEAGRVVHEHSSNCSCWPKG